MFLVHVRLPNVVYRLLKKLFRIVGKVLVWCRRNSLNNLCHSGQAGDKLARPGVQESQKLLDARFRGYDDGRIMDLLRELPRQDIAASTACSYGGQRWRDDLNVLNGFNYLNYLRPDSAISGLRLNGEPGANSI